MVKYIICEAKGYGEVGEVLRRFDNFKDLISEIKKMHKQGFTRYLVTNCYCNYIYFSGLQVEDCYSMPDTHKMTKDNLTWNFQYDFFCKGYMYA